MELSITYFFVSEIKIDDYLVVNYVYLILYICSDNYFAKIVFNT
jgi:hypothetical protein